VDRIPDNSVDIGMEHRTGLDEMCKQVVSFDIIWFPFAKSNLNARQRVDKTTAEVKLHPSLDLNYGQP
jgi:hypothetical protein